jgi:hypothetical protein
MIEFGAVLSPVIGLLVIVFVLVGITLRILFGWFLEWREKRKQDATPLASIADKQQQAEHAYRAAPPHTRAIKIPNRIAPHLDEDTRSGFAVGVTWEANETSRFALYLLLGFRAVCVVFLKRKP